jgi:hypothetical protein
MAPGVSCLLIMRHGAILGFRLNIGFGGPVPHVKDDHPAG